MLIATDCIVKYICRSQYTLSEKAADNATTVRVLDLPLGTFHKTPRIIQAPVRQSDKTTKKECVTIEIDDLEIQPLTLYKVYDEIIPNGKVTASKLCKKGNYVCFHTHDNLIFYRPGRDIYSRATSIRWPKPKHTKTLDFCHIGNFDELMTTILASYKKQLSR